MSQRTKLIVLLLTLLIIFAGLVLVWRLKGKPTVQLTVINEPEVTTETPAQKEGAFVLPEVILDETKKQEIPLAQQAADFTERIGSYSKAGNLENIGELKPFMTAAMQKWTDDYAEKLEEETKADFGITTKVLNSKVIDLVMDKLAKVALSTQRTETATGQQKIYYQDMEIELIKEGDAWLVNKADWK